MDPVARGERDRINSRFRVIIASASAVSLLAVGVVVGHLCAHAPPSRTGWWVVALLWWSITAVWLWVCGTVLYRSWARAFYERNEDGHVEEWK